MNDYKQQEKEILTIKERSIALNLSDNDCEKISILAGLGGLTVSNLLENFIGDLIDGTYSNGSDEREKASDWYDRCGFSYMNEDTLLHHLLYQDHDVDDFITIYDELKFFENNPQEFADEIAELEDGEQHWFEKDYHEYVDDYLKKNKEVDIEKEIDACRKWLNNIQEFKFSKTHELIKLNGSEPEQC